MTKEAITIRYLSGHDVAALALDNDEILDAIEASLRAQPVSLVGKCPVRQLGSINLIGAIRERVQALDSTGDAWNTPSRRR